MSEIKSSDISETKQTNVDNYNNIQPEKETTVQEATNIVKEKFYEVPRYIININESLENDRHPITGVQFERRIVELPSGEKIEGVFAKFDSKFDAQIKEDLYLKSDKAQFKECNRQLFEEIEKSDKLKSQFSKEQIEQIKEGISDGSAPDGYVWHHDAEAGKIQLVDSETHAKTGHTGGRVIWGGGQEKR